MKKRKKIITLKFKVGGGSLEEHETSSSEFIIFYFLT
jgi:hypothetical protein